MRLSRGVAVFSAGALLIGLSGCVIAYPAVEGKFTRTLNVSGTVDLDIASSSGGIDIRAGSASSVQIFGVIRAGHDWGGGDPQEKVRYLEANPPIEQAGSLIRIGRIDNAAYRNNVSISYEIVVPPDTRVKASTGSGRLKVEGTRGPVDGATGSGSVTILRVREGVTARTGSGSITLDDIEGDVDAHTGSGSIRGQGIAGSVRAQTGSGSIDVGLSGGGMSARDAEVVTGSGSIEVSGIDGSLHAKTGSGGIRISGNPSGDWDVDASSGSVTLSLDDKSAFDLVAHSSSGKITVDHPVEVTGASGKHDLRGKVRGGGRLVDIRTHSGGIVIR